MDQMITISRMEGVPVPPAVPVPPIAPFPPTAPCPPPVPVPPAVPVPPIAPPSPPAYNPPTSCTCPALGMAYVPLQEWRSLYESDVGFARGTLFTELDKPFIGEEVRFV